MRISNLVIITLLASNVLFAFLFFGKQEAVPVSEPISESLVESEAESPSVAEPPPSVEEASYLAAMESLEEENRALQKEVDDLKNELSVYNARRQRPRAANVRTRPTRFGDPMIAMLEDEATAELGLDWIRTDQSRRFASLIALCELSAERKEELIVLLTDRYAHRSDLNQFGTDALPEEELQDIEASYQNELRSLVGDSMAELFLKAETKPLSFARIQEIDTHMRFGDEPLTQEQYLPIWNLLSNTIQVGERMSDESSVVAVTERSISNNLSMLTEAEAILTPSQYVVFEERILSDITLA